MNVRQLLSRKGREVLTIDPTATLAAAVRLLAEGHIGALVVASADGRIAGIISERDIILALNQTGTAVLELPGRRDYDPQGRDLRRYHLSCGDHGTDDAGQSRSGRLGTRN